MAFAWGGPKSTQPLEIKTLAEVAREAIERVRSAPDEDEEENNDDSDQDRDR